MQICLLMKILKPGVDGSKRKLSMNAAGFLDDGLIWVGLDVLAVVPGAVGAGRAGVSLAGDGILG